MATSEHSPAAQCTCPRAALWYCSPSEARVTHLHDDATFRRALAVNVGDVDLAIFKRETHDLGVDLLQKVRGSERVGSESRKADAMQLLCATDLLTVAWSSFFSFGTVDQCGTLGVEAVQAARIFVLRTRAASAGALFRVSSKRSCRRNARGTSSTRSAESTFSNKHAVSSEGNCSDSPGTGTPKRCESNQPPAHCTTREGQTADGQEYARVSLRRLEFGCFAVSKGGSHGGQRSLE